MAAVFADGMDRPLRVRVPFGEHRERAAVTRAGVAARGATALAARRRAAACGPACVTGRPCTLLELRTADLLAAAPDDAWLRIWAEALLLAFLTNRPVPVVPAPLQQRWAELDPRLRECLLATVARAGPGRPGAGRADLARPGPAGRRGGGHRAAHPGRRQGRGDPAGPGLGDPAAALAARDRPGRTRWTATRRTSFAPGPAAGLRAARRAGRARHPDRAAGQRAAPQPLLDGAGPQPDARLDRPARRGRPGAASPTTWPAW